MAGLLFTSLFFLLKGIFFPNTFLLSMIIGVSWEIFEDWVDKTRPKWLEGIGNCISIHSNYKKYW